MEHVVGAWAEEMSVNADDQRDSQRKDNQESGNFAIPLRKYHETDDRKQINHDEQRNREFWEVWLNSNNQCEMPHVQRGNVLR